MLPGQAPCFRRVFTLACGELCRPTDTSNVVIEKNMATGSWVRSAASGINTHQEGFAHLDGDERLSFLDIQPDAVAFREESLAPTGMTTEGKCCVSF